MKKFIRVNLLFPFFCIVFINPRVLAQDSIYIPRNILRAYKNGTRSFDGKPGKNYWQNSSDYQIDVNVNPKTRILSGTEEITYHNNSPDSLDYIVFRLYQNMNKPTAARNNVLDEKSITQGDIIDELKVNDKDVNVDSTNIVKVRDTNMYLYLSKALHSQDSLHLKFQWHFTIPGGDNPRMGMYDSTSFFIGYWYPQVAVYDDIDGWDTYNYTGTQEFYNDFSNYDVKINVPNNYGVWSTGVLQNPDEVLTGDYLKKYNQVHGSDSVIHIVTADDIKNGSIYFNSKKYNTWHYKASNVTDFAFGTSDHYLWDGVSLAPDSENQNNRIYIAAVYRAQSKEFSNVCKIARDAINYYSTSFPGILFPYPSLTVFNGRSGGMEYPMIVNDGTYPQFYSTVYVTSHEIAHTYFPFYMGTNERKYAWMDEGMATFIPYEFQQKEGGFNYELRDSFIYDRTAGDETEMPPIIPSVFLEGNPYEIASYMRPGLAYHFLQETIGKQKFKKIFQEYIKRWHGKHTLPYDFFFTFDNLYYKDLSWFWKPWFFERDFPDMAIKKVKYENDSIAVSIEKVGKIPLPIALVIKGKNGEADSLYRTASVWSDGSKEIIMNDKLNFKPMEIELGNLGIPDIDQSNNIYLFNNNTENKNQSNN
jgi:Peptidase family M1 domain